MSPPLSLSLSLSFLVVFPKIDSRHGLIMTVPMTTATATAVATATATAKTTPPSLTSSRRRLVVTLVGLAIASFFNLIKSGFNLKLLIDGDLSGLGGGRGRAGRIKGQGDEDEAISPQYSTLTSTSSIPSTTNPGYRSMKEVPNEPPLLTTKTMTTVKKTTTSSTTTKKKLGTKVATSVRGENNLVTKTQSNTTSSKPATTGNEQTTQKIPLKKTLSANANKATKKKGNNSTTNKKNKKERPANWVATTPVGMKLDEPFVEQRHYCLSKAREKHIEALGPIIFPNERPQPRELLFKNANTTKDGIKKTKVLDVLLVDPAYHGMCVCF